MTAPNRELLKQGILGALLAFLLAYMACAVGCR